MSTLWRINRICEILFLIYCACSLPFFIAIGDWFMVSLNGIILALHLGPGLVMRVLWRKPRSPSPP